MAGGRVSLTPTFDDYLASFSARKVLNFLSGGRAMLVILLFLFTGREKLTTNTKIRILMEISSSIIIYWQQFYCPQIMQEKKF